MKDLAIYGAGGMGRETYCMICDINKHSPTWRFVGFFDDNLSLKGSENEYGPILGGIDDLNAWSSPISVVVCIGSPYPIKSVVERISNKYVDFPNIYSPSAYFSDISRLKIGQGNIICRNCMVGTNVTIGDFNMIIDTSYIGHDSTVGNCNVFMPGSAISGGITIGDNNFFGFRSAVMQGLSIGDGNRIGAGSILIKNAQDNHLYFGNPAIAIKDISNNK